MGRKHDLKRNGQPTPGQRRIAKGWLESQDPELAAVLNAPGTRAEKRAALAAYLAKRPVVTQDEDTQAHDPEDTMAKDPERQAIRWTDADLDAFTSPEALMAAQDEIAQAWRRDAAPAAGGLIDAGERDDATT